MTMELPSETLRLGRDLPPGPDGRMFPVDLETIENDHLISILTVLDYTIDSSVGSGARDLGNLERPYEFYRRLLPFAAAGSDPLQSAVR